MEYVQEQFTADDERGGNGLYRWFEKNYDVKSPKMWLSQVEKVNRVGFHFSPFLILWE